MKKTFPEKKLTLFPPPPSTFPMKGKKKTLTFTPLPLNSIKKRRKKNQGAPFPPSHNE
jgi:hypothetical protein